MRPWEILLARLRAARRWPLPDEAKIREWLLLWAALRESDEAVIRQLMKWPTDRPLMIDNLPEKIATAYGDLLFGQDPDVTAADERDQARAEMLTEPWAAELPAAEETCVSEGEVWWRQTTTPALPHPVLTWHSRVDVVPLLRGRTVLAAAFVSRLPQIGSDRQTVYRHVELHDAGVVVNVLFRGRRDALGAMVDLGRHPETADLVERWDTGVAGLLCGRVVNRWGRKPLAGVSIFAGVWTRFLGLNEATTVGRENMRLTAKKRAVVPASAIRAQQRRPDGSVDSVDRGDGVRVPVMPSHGFDAGEDVLIADSLDVEEGREGSGPFKVLEYSFDADQLIAWLRFEIETVCQRCDIVPQFIGSGDFGNAASGTALRVRLLPTVNAAEGRGRAWDTELPIIAQRAQLLEAQPIAFGGLGADWSNPGGSPAIERSSALPEDPNEVAQRHATLKTADLISIEQSIRERHPDWDSDAIDKEVEAIRADISATLPATTFGGDTPPPPPPGG